MRIVNEYPITKLAFELADEAATCLRKGDVGGAAWRLADALGLIKSSCPCSDIEAIMGITEPTSRGYKLA